MELHRTAVVTDEPAAAAGRVRAALNDAGWREQSGALAFTRGTIPGTLLGVSPEWWRARAGVIVVPDGAGARVELAMAVRTTGQVVTALERRFWEAEADEAIAAAASPDVAPRKSRALAAAAVRQNVVAAVVIVCGTAAAATGLGRYLDSLVAYVFGAAAGLAVTLTWASWRLKVTLK